MDRREGASGEWFDRINKVQYRNIDRDDYELFISTLLVAPNEDIVASYFPNGTFIYREMEEILDALKDWNASLPTTWLPDYGKN